MSGPRDRLFYGWPLFWFIAALTFVAILAGLGTTGVATPETAVEMIRFSVQLASPWVFLAFVARPLGQLAPGALSNWLLRNRRYLGLSFATGFGWQAVFIGVLLTRYPDYYWQELHNDLDLLLRLLSYLFLLALTVTSFFPVRRLMRTEHWRLLHLVGIWYFWAAIWVSYAGQAASAGARTIDFVFTLLGLLALLLRLAAYLQARSRNPARRSVST
jgi:DMSO/TMAO reductase YedYZ heme-binding membrane subunit